jgi:hypothetical protein
MRRHTTLAAAAAIMLAGCASGRSATTTTTTTRAAAPVRHHRQPRRSPRTTSCCTSGQPQVYAGLGAAKPTYVANNTQTPPNPAGAPYGIAWYQIAATSPSGHVIAAEVTVKATPPMSDRERMALLLGEGLPDDARQAHGGTDEAVNNDHCEVWQSRKLKALTRDSYAKVTTVTGTPTADITAEPSPTC